MGWSYKRTESTFEVLPVGVYRIRIASADKTTASTGKKMLSLKFDVSGSKSKLFHNIVFLPDRPEITNRNLTQFFDSFKDIADGDFNTENWIGKVGAAEVCHDEYNGNTTARIKYFIHKDKQANLPPWADADGKPAPQPDADGFLQAGADGEMPWDM